MTDLQSSTPHTGEESVHALDHASRGQILIMFAVMLTVLLGAVGLSVDLGISFSQRRTMQSAADAGAYAGTRIVSKSITAAPKSAWAEVQTVVNKNKMAVGTITSITCNYVTDSGAVVTPCTSTVPPTASGVEVTVEESHPTYFIRVIPGAAKTVTTSATARANVKKLGVPTDGPYLPCGINTQLAGGGTLSLVTQSGGSGWQINPDAVNKTFVIHGPQIEKCKAHASRYKGLANSDLNKNLPIPGWFNYKEGDTAGWISADVEGPDGCKAGQEVVNCVVFLPIVIDSPEEQNNDRRQWCVGFAPFYITAPGPNLHWGKLLGDYLVYGKGQDGNWGWEQGYDGPITIRLTK